MVQALAIVFILFIFIIILIAMSIVQIRMAGIKVKDFFSFIDANQKLDSLSNFAKRYDKMSPQEQIIYLSETEKIKHSTEKIQETVREEKIFDSFDKIPETVWEEERDKYSKVLDTYKNIRVMRWNEAQTNALTTKKIKPKEMKVE